MREVLQVTELIMGCGVSLHASSQPATFQHATSNLHLPPPLQRHRDSSKQRACLPAVHICACHLNILEIEQHFSLTVLVNCQCFSKHNVS